MASFIVALLASTLVFSNVLALQESNVQGKEEIIKSTKY